MKGISPRKDPFGYQLGGLVTVIGGVMTAIGFPLGSAFGPVGLAFIVCGLAFLGINFAFFMMLGSGRPKREGGAEGTVGEK